MDPVGDLRSQLAIAIKEKEEFEQQYGEALCANETLCELVERHKMTGEFWFWESYPFKRPFLGVLSFLKGLFWECYPF